MNGAAGPGENGDTGKRDRAGKDTRSVRGLGENNGVRKQRRRSPGRGTGRCKTTIGTAGLTVLRQGRPPASGETAAPANALTRSATARPRPAERRPFFC